MKIKMTEVPQEESETLEGLNDPYDLDFDVHVPKEADKEASDHFLGSLYLKNGYSLVMRWRKTASQIFQIQTSTSQRMRMRIP